MKNVFKTFGVAILGGVIALSGYKLLIEKPLPVVEQENTVPTLQTIKAGYSPTVINNSSAPTDFTEAADKTVHAVVHVKNTAIREEYNPWAEFFYGRDRAITKRKSVGTGSGVIISADGYIVTNNHVVNNATEIEVTLNNGEKIAAKLIGTDADNDIALLKVDADMELPYIPFGNSDYVKVGEWVLAVGNPYNLASTVTAGIVSAKGRDLEGNKSMESFIQTDAAVNEGNSGGALVNIRGELIGINTAISSNTGSFIGYSFAVPSNIAKKIIDDLLEYGDVQEAILGISITQENENVRGVLISDVELESGAAEAGLAKGDIITKINDVEIVKFSDLKGQLTAKRPGDNIAITILRDGNEIEKVVTLSKNTLIDVPALNIKLKDLTKEEKKKYKIKGGAKIGENKNRSLLFLGVESGYILTKINKKEIVNALEAKEVLTEALRTNNPLSIEVINLNGERERYGFGN